jgi:16S rRNA G966 N2-methylase RsmD
MVKRMSTNEQIPVLVNNDKPILYLSPNPHLGDFCAPLVPVKEIKEPYSKSISAGKNTYVYDAHTYHTKVPPQGIELLFDYYTRPGDVVLDPFCGSGMTGVATTQKGRKAILCDLSPAATFIAFNLNTPIEASRYMHAVHSVLQEARELEENLYNTPCRTCGQLTPMLYMVWSFGLICSHCNNEFVLWDVARDEQPRVRDSKIKSEFECPHCNKTIKKRSLKRTRRYPVSVGYRCCEKGLKETTNPLTDYDLATLERIEKTEIPSELWYPTASFPEGLNTKQPIAAGITTVNKAYTPRALWSMAYLWNKATNWSDPDVRLKLLFTLTSLYQRVTVFSEFRFWGGSGNTANFNVPAIMNEQNVFRAFSRKANTISWYFKSTSSKVRPVQVSTQSACHLTQLPDKSVDYIFTDPPFGGNINYSEMNFLWESWLGVYTDNTEEAIINKVQKKSFDEYSSLLSSAFSEMRRVLKDEGWLTVVFHNSSDRVWNALQRAINQSGLIIKGTQTFDKEHGTFKQFVSDNAVGYDLVLHCKKSAAADDLKRHDYNDTLSEAENFISKAIKHIPDKYVVHYLHVTRADEFDYRKLYADWLAIALPKSLVGMSFEQFRALAKEILTKKE